MSTPPPLRVEVDPPPIEPRRHTLLSTASVIEMPDMGPWQNGVEFFTDACDDSNGVVTGPCPDPIPPITATAQLHLKPTITCPSGYGIEVCNDEESGFTVHYSIAHDPPGPPPITGDIAPGDCVIVPLGVVIAALASLTPGTGWTGLGATVHIPAGEGDYDVDLTATQDPADPEPGTPTPQAAHTKTFVEGRHLIQSPEPFTIYGTYKCSTIGGDPDPVAVARRRLELNEWRWVERMVEILLLKAAGATVPVQTAPYGVRQALGVLEALAAREYAGQPWIHAPIELYPYAADLGLIVPDGNRLRTPLGSTWIFGAGYLPGPAGPTPHVAPAGTEFWMYATGPIVLRRSGVFPAPGDAQQLDQRTNEVHAIQERTYVAAMDCLHAAVAVDPDEDCCEVPAP